MKRSLRVTAGVIATAAGLLAMSVPAGAVTFKIDAIMKNDLKLKTAPSPQLEIGGSSFDGPLVLAAQTKWNADNHKTAFAAYNITKSGTGRANVISGAYNIGFSDFPLNQVPGSPDVGAGSPNPTKSVAQFVQVPIDLGGVAIIFHFGTGISGTLASCLRKYPLSFHGSTLGKIFAGKITNWDSATIKADNPHCGNVGGGFPNLPIAVESRTSGSGTTFIYKSYLSLADHADYPSVDANAFTVAADTFANSGLLAAGVASTNGAIGYVEYGYAIANDLQTASLYNKSNKDVPLTEAGIVDAATVGLKAITANKHACPHGFATTSLACYEVNNELGLTVYPIAGFSYAILYKAQTNQAAAIAEVKFLDFLSHQGGGHTAATTFGQDLADANGYAPMPVSVQSVARKLLLGVTYKGKAVLTATD